MNKTEIKIFISFLVSLIVILLSCIIFFIKINVFKIANLVSDGSVQIISVNKKIHNYIQRQSEYKIYKVNDIVEQNQINAYLYYAGFEHDWFNYYVNNVDGSLLPLGIYQVNVNYGDIVFYEYWLYFT